MFCLDSARLYDVCVFVCLERQYAWCFKGFQLLSPLPKIKYVFSGCINAVKQGSFLVLCVWGVEQLSDWRCNAVVVSCGVWNKGCITHIIAVNFVLLSLSY